MEDNEIHPTQVEVLSAPPISPVLLKLAQLEARLSAIESFAADSSEKQSQVLKFLHDLLEKPVAQFSVAFPSYVGKVLGKSVKLTPEKES